ncbi:hypothetical protein H0H87_011189 [Tephrocybe sp. NHM501043]|nr:hypothetical protein H0H87_011189 [Tephrocybe sp. NHM501043]
MPRSKEKVKRPPNAFFLYRQEKCRLEEVKFDKEKQKYRKRGDISRLIADMWSQEKPQIQLLYERAAEIKKLEHAAKYPWYKYRPNRNSASKEVEGPRLTMKSKQPIVGEEASEVVEHHRDIESPTLTPDPHFTESNGYSPAPSQPSHSGGDVNKMGKGNESFHTLDFRQPVNLFSQPSSISYNDSIVINETGCVKPVASSPSHTMGSMTYNCPLATDPHAMDHTVRDAAWVGGPGMFASPSVSTPDNQSHQAQPLAPAIEPIHYYDAGVEIVPSGLRPVDASATLANNTDPLSNVFYTPRSNINDNRYRTLAYNHDTSPAEPANTTASSYDMEPLNDVFYPIPNNASHNRYPGLAYNSSHFLNSESLAGPFSFNGHYCADDSTEVDPSSKSSRWSVAYDGVNTGSVLSPAAPYALDPALIPSGTHGIWSDNTFVEWTYNTQAADLPTDGEEATENNPTPLLSQSRFDFDWTFQF